MFVDRTVEATRQEFSVGRALRGTGLGPGGTVVDRLRRRTDTLERHVVEPELEAYRDRSVSQFRVVLTAVESERPVEAFEAELLEHDSMVQALDPELSSERRRVVVEDVLERLQRLGDGVAPIIERPEDEFWSAVRGAFDEESARSWRRSSRLPALSGATATRSPSKCVSTPPTYSPVRWPGDFRPSRSSTPMRRYDPCAAPNDGSSTRPRPT